MVRSNPKKSRKHPRSEHRGGIAEAKVFMTGRSQAVRLPKEFRVSGDTVGIKRLGQDILLIPKKENRWADFFAALEEFSRSGPEFTLERDQRQERPGLDRLFERDSD